MVELHRGQSQSIRSPSPLLTHVALQDPRTNISNMTGVTMTTRKLKIQLALVEIPLA